MPNIVYTVAERLEMVRHREQGLSYRHIVDHFVAAHPDRPVPSKTTIQRMVGRFHATGCVNPTLKKISYPTRQLNEDKQLDIFLAVQEGMRRGSKKPLAVIAKEFNVSKSSVHKILHTEKFRSRKYRDRCQRIRDTEFDAENPQTDPNTDNSNDATNGATDDADLTTSSVSPATDIANDINPAENTSEPNRSHASITRINRAQGEPQHVQSKPVLNRLNQMTFFDELKLQLIDEADPPASDPQPTRIPEIHSVGEASDDTTACPGCSQDSVPRRDLASQTEDVFIRGKLRSMAHHWSLIEDCRLKYGDSRHAAKFYSDIVDRYRRRNQSATAGSNDMLYDGPTTRSLLGMPYHFHSRNNRMNNGWQRALL